MKLSVFTTWPNKPRLPLYWQKCLILPAIINIIPVKEVHSLLSVLNDHHKLQWISSYRMRRTHLGPRAQASGDRCPSPVLSCCLSFWNGLMSPLPRVKVTKCWSLEWREHPMSVEVGKSTKRWGGPSFSFIHVVVSLTLNSVLWWLIADLDCGFLNCWSKHIMVQLGPFFSACLSLVVFSFIGSFSYYEKKQMFRLWN